MDLRRLKRAVLCACVRLLHHLLVEMLRRDSARGVLRGRLVLGFFMDTSIDAPSSMDVSLPSIVERLRSAGSSDACGACAPAPCLAGAGRRALARPPSILPGAGHVPPGAASYLGEVDGVQRVNSRAAGSVEAEPLAKR